MPYKYKAYGLNRLTGEEITVRCTADLRCDYDVKSLSGIYCAYNTSKRIFSLDQIPDAMDKSGMPVGAALMRRWFAYGSRAMTQPEKEGDAPYPAHLIEPNIVKMEWVLRYGVARAAYSSLLQKTHLTRHLARAAFLRKMKRAGAFFPQIKSINTTNVPTLHADWQFQFIRVGGHVNNLTTYLAGADDLYAALANFTLCAAPATIIVRPFAKDHWQVNIPEIAIYVRDTYDFYDDGGGNQYLGHWNASGMSMSMGMRNSIESRFDASHPSDFHFPVSNDAFRSWQASHPNGGDFIVFSDAKIEKIPGGGIDFIVTKDQLNALK